MTTEPLDIRSLLAAAGDRPWTGMPAGTTMGHVHLHVGDLDARGGLLSPRARLRQSGVELPGRALPVRRRLSPSSGHQHLVVRTARDGRRCAPAVVDGVAACRRRMSRRRRRSLRAAGYAVQEAEDGVLAADPWGTRVRLNVM